MYIYIYIYINIYIHIKSKGNPRQAEVALGFLGRLRSAIFSTFGTTRVVGRQTRMVLSEKTKEKIPSDIIGDQSWERPTSSAAP